MTQPRPITADEARAVLKAQHLARTTLTGYARYIDIPGVPDSADVDDRQYAVVETPLAQHHVVMLNAMQLMAQGLLLYRIPAEHPNPSSPIEGAVSWGVLRGETAPGGRAGGGVPDSHVHAPSGNFKKVQFSSNSQEILSRQEPHLSDTEVIHAALRGVLEGRVSPEDAFQIIHDETGAWSVCRRVLLMLPPGSAKSTYASVVFPTWVMGRVKAFETILTGWGDPICRRHGKRARQVCSSPQYKALFGVEVDANTRAAEDWQCTNFSSYKSSGITSGISGFRANGLIWDDLIRNRKDADSVTIRQDVWNEYTDSARSRKTPDAWEVGIGTRWHEDEHMGRILPEGYSGESGFIRCRDGNVWFVICMAAEAERQDDPLGREIGEMIWPEWFNEDYWGEKKINMRSWASLYQQRPAPDEGLVFKKEWFRRYRERPGVAEGCELR